MTLATGEFIRRFLIHVLPAGFHRIRHYGLLASGKRAENIDRARELLTLPVLPVDAIKAVTTNADQSQPPEHRCPCCGGRMIIIERFERRVHSALSPKRVNAGDQDRHLMMTSVRSPCLNASHFCRYRLAEHAPARTNPLLTRNKLPLDRRFSAPRSDHRKSARALHATQRLHLSPRAARQPLKSP